MALTHLRNPFRGRGLDTAAFRDLGGLKADPADAQALFGLCPRREQTPLRNMPVLARELAVAGLDLKDESRRLGLGSFKALGASHAIARHAVRQNPSRPPEDLAGSLAGTVFACASAGNHGLSVAAGARAFGAEAVIFVSESVPHGFIARLQGHGARVERTPGDYEDSMRAAAEAARSKGWTLLSDSSWPGYLDWPRRVMEGYLIMGAEIGAALSAPPTHVFLQAGVGGFAAAMAAWIRAHWGDAPVIIVVEPEAAPALMESVRAGAPTVAPGPVSTMGRLDCKEPSLLALHELARSADHFVAISDRAVADTVALLDGHGIATTPSGAAGVAALHHAGALRPALGLSEEGRVLAVITEGPEDGA